MHLYVLFFTSISLFNTIFSQDVSNELSFAKVVFEKGNYTECISLADSYLNNNDNFYMSNDPRGVGFNWTNLLILGLKGQALFELERYTDAIAVLKDFDERILKYSNEPYRRIDQDDIDMYKSEIANNRATLGRSYIILGYFAQAEDYCEYASKNYPDDLSFILNMAHCLFLNNKKDEARKYYTHAVNLIIDTQEFDDYITPDFNYFISKNWEIEALSEQLEEMKIYLNSRNIPWDAQRPNEFQLCNTTQFDSLKQFYITESDRAISSIFHFTTKFNNYNYEEAATEEGGVNHFSIKRLQTEHQNILDKAKDIGSIYPGKFVLENNFILKTESYDFKSHSFVVDLLQILNDNLPHEILFFKYKREHFNYCTWSGLSYKIINLPSKLKVNVGNVNLAEDFSKSNCTVYYYFEIPDHISPVVKQTKVESTSFFVFLLTKGYKSIKSVSKSQLPKLEKEYKYKNHNDSPYDIDINFTMNLIINRIEMKLPNDQLITWIPKSIK